MSRTILTLAASFLFAGSALAATVDAGDVTADEAAVDASADPSVDAPADDAAAPCDDEVQYANKGAYVRAMREQGLRGRELAQAVHDYGNNTPMANHEGAEPNGERVADRVRAQKEKHDRRADS